jgi:hypothetical protein
MTPKKSLSAVMSQARQNKSSHSSSSLSETGTDSRTWNTLSQAAPMMRNLSVKDNRPYRIIQSRDLGNVCNSVTGVASGYAKVVTSADLTQFSSLSAVFDQYKIDLIEIWFTTYGNVGQNQGGSGANLYSVIDYDNATNLSSTLQALQYENVSVGASNVGHYRRYKPHIAVAAYGSSAFAQFKNEPAGWIDCVSTAVEHYGVKIIVDPTSSAGDVHVNAFLRIHASFRNVF